MKRGLVIGKFYPPHRGHKLLIDTAIANSDKVTVIVCYHKKENIPGKLRAGWIKEIHPQAEVILIDDDLTDDLAGASPEEVSKCWAEFTVKTLGYAPEIVFTSEEYGKRWAKYLGSEHFLVDIDRKTMPVSGTKVRSNPQEYWDFLEPCVRAYFSKRIVVLGAESTGTTTMAKALAEYYKTSWVPEFGRFYSEGKLSAVHGTDWSTNEFIFIASEQNRMEDELAKTSNKLLICDTDSFATTLWHERYMGFISPEVDAVGAGRKYDLYLLTGDEIPFVQDGTRDGEHIRNSMHKRFTEELKKRGKPYLLLTGTHEERLKKAVEAIDKIQKTALT